METEILKCDCCARTLSESEPCVRMNVINAPARDERVRSPDSWFDAEAEEPEDRPRRRRRLDYNRADYCMTCFAVRAVKDAALVAEGVAPTRAPL
jgi:hypothetical protein